MGLPVLTQVGRSFSARVAASLLNAVGLPDLAVADERAYEERAVALAADRTASDPQRRPTLSWSRSCPRRSACIPWAGSTSTPPG